MTHRTRSATGLVLIASITAAAQFFVVHFGVIPTLGWLIAGPVGAGFILSLIGGWRPVATMLMTVGLVSIAADQSPMLLLPVLAGLAVEASLAAFWVRGGPPFRPTFDRPTEVFHFVLGAAGAAAGHGLTAMLVAWGLGLPEPGLGGILAAAASWFSILLFAPTLLIWLFGGPPPKRQWLDWIEVVFVLIVVVGVTLYWFTGPKAALNRLPIPTLAILVMLANWIAFRLGTHGMATFSIVVAAVIGISRVVYGQSPSGFLTYDAHLELAADCFGLGAVLCFHLGLAAAARRHSLRESEREQLLLTEYAQSDRVRNLNEKLSLQALEMADQARQFEEQRDQYQQLADELTLKRAFQDAMLDQLPVGILVSDHTGRVLQNNPEFLRMVGAAPDAELAHLQDYRGWPVFRMDGTQLAYDDYPLVQTLKSGRPTPPTEFRIRLPDGREQPLAASATPIFSHSSSQIGAVLVLHDLNAIRQAERQVAQSEERLQFTLRSARMIAWDWNLTSGEITRSSPLEGWLGLPTDIKYSMNGSFADRLHPDDRTHALETMDALRRGALTDCEFEYRLQHVDGHYVWLDSRGRAIRDSNNQTTGQLTGVL
ncbi:MAG: PAS domain-containing protein, partial [Gemmataceae bacterium]